MPGPRRPGSIPALASGWGPSPPHLAGSRDPQERPRPRRGGSSRAQKRALGPPPAGSSEARKKAKKWPFLGPLWRKVQGEWGGSAHSPDPTAQSSRNAAARRRQGPGVRGRLGGVRWVGCGGCLGGCAPLCCVTQCSDWDGRKGRLEREVLAGAKTYFRGGTPRCSGSPARTCGTTRNPCPTRQPSKGGSSVLEMLSHLSASHRVDGCYV